MYKAYAVCALASPLAPSATLFVRCMAQEGSGSFNGLFRLAWHFLVSAPSVRSPHCCLLFLMGCTDPVLGEAFFHFLALCCSSVWVFFVDLIKEPYDPNTSSGFRAEPCSGCNCQRQTVFPRLKVNVLLTDPPCYKLPLWNCLCREHRKQDLYNFFQSTLTHWH